VSLVLRVAGDRWRTHLRAVAEAHPGIVPVIKGNGYGLGLSRLARRAGWLGAPTAAVGTYAEVPEVGPRFDGDLLVLSPWRPWIERGPYDDRLIHTVGRVEDLQALADRGDRPRVVLECLTSMHRHGLTPTQLHTAARALPSVRLAGAALHLPMAGDRLAEVESWIGRIHASGLATDRLYVSHLADHELAALRSRHPDLVLLPRIGTALWLGDREALEVRATVLDRHRVTRGQRVGYRQRRVRSSGTLLIVSGGTSHGIGLEAPNATVSSRQRAGVLARGGLQAAGLALSPFTVAGRRRWFAEPPHMQASMLFLPGTVSPPAVGEELAADVRFTTTRFDRIEIT